MMDDRSYIGDELLLFSLAANWKRYVAGQIRPYIGNSVLEVGAGIGGTTRFLRSGDEARWVCLEPAPELRRNLEQTLKEHETTSNCTIVGGVVSNYPKTERFDTIIYLDVLEHIQDDRNELETAARLLEKGGHLIVLCPAYQALFSAFDQAVGHFRRYRAASLISLTPPSLEPISSVYLDSAGVALTLANRLLLRQYSPTSRQVSFWDRMIIPISRVLDVLTFRTFGRSVVVIWRKTS